MNASVRELRRGENDPEMLLLGGTAGTALMGLGWMGSGLPLPPCVFHAVTGCPCPTCGATRCVLALLHGRVAEAVGWNPLVFAGLVMLAVLNVYAATVVLGGMRRVRVGWSGREGRALRVAFILGVGANWAYLIHHGV